MKTVACGLLLLSIAPLTMAQSSERNVELDQLVPNTIDQFIEYKTSAQNPFNELITSAFDNLTTFQKFQKNKNRLNIKTKGSFTTKTK